MKKYAQKQALRRWTMTAVLTALALPASLAWTAPSNNAFAADSTDTDSTASMETTSSLTQDRDHAIAYMHQSLAKDNFRYVQDWPALTLYAAGIDPTSANWRTADGKSGIDWRRDDVLKTVNITDTTTDFESTLLGLLAAKQDPRQFGKKDFVQAVIDSQLPDDGKFADSIYGYGEDLLNAHIYGIISLYAAGVPIPNAKQATDYLLKKQHTDGGFTYSNGVSLSDPSDPDVTAMALIAMKALGLDANNANVQKALHFLQTTQQADGGFVNQGVANPDTDSVVIEALLMYGMDPTTWKQGSNDPIRAMLSFQLADGSFTHTKNGAGDMMATQNAALALADLLQKSSVYQRLHDSNVSVSSTWHSAFPDLPLTHRYYSPNIRLVNLGVMAGDTNGLYEPENTVTREQFAKILVYALPQLKDQVGPKITKFKDLSTSAWSNPFVQVAVQNGYIVGTSPNTFAPQGPVTGAQVVAILDRMLNLDAQGHPQPGDANWYDRYVQVAKQQNLLYPNFDPTKNATRAEVGVAFNNFYQAQMKQQQNQ